jgi:hypothetical protein
MPQPTVWIYLLTASVMWVTGGLVKPFAALIPLGPVSLRSELGFACLQVAWLLVAGAWISRSVLFHAVLISCIAEAIVETIITRRVRRKIREDGRRPTVNDVMDFTSLLRK